MKIASSFIYISFKDFVYFFISLLRGDLKQSLLIKTFERNFAHLIGADNVVTTSMARISLYYSLKALGLRAGDRILMTPVTIPEMVAVLDSLGIEITYIDFLPHTFMVDIELYKYHLNHDIKAVYITHLAGQISNMSMIYSLAKEYGVSVIQDSTQVLNSTYDDSPLTQYADISIFSLCEFKFINTFKGGIIATNNDDLMEKIKVIIADEVLDRSIFSLIHNFIFVFILYLVFNSWLRYFLFYPLSYSLKQDLKVDKFKNLKPRFFIFNRNDYDQMKVGIPDNMKYKLSDCEAKLGIRQLIKLPYWQNKQNEFAEQVIAICKKSDKVSLSSYCDEIKYWRLSITFKNYGDHQIFCNHIKNIFLPQHSGLNYLDLKYSTPEAKKTLENSIYVPIQYSLTKMQQEKIKYALQKFLLS